MTFLRLDEAKMPSDYVGRKSFNTIFGESVVGTRQDDVSINFQYSNSTRDVTPTVSGSGTTSNSNQRATVSITGAVGSARLQTVDAIRYRPGHEVTSQFTAVFEGAQSGVNHYIGLLDTTDGIAWGMQDGVFGVWFIENSTETFVPQSAFNGDKLDGTGESGFVVDPTMMNIYQVQYGWLGIAPLILSIYTGSDTGWVRAHTFDFVNSQAIPHLRNPSLPISVLVRRLSGTGTDANLRTSSVRAGVVSGDLELNSSNRWFAFTSVDFPHVSTVRNNVFTLRNKATYQGLTNHIVVELGIVAFDNSTNKTVAFYGVDGATLAGNSPFTDIDTANSVMEVSTGGTLSGGTRGPSTIRRSNSDIRTDVRGTGILIYPGRTFTFETQSGAGTNGTVSISARWVERF
jgi:hypothetical protein